MLYLIVTARSLAWMLLGLFATLLMLVALVNPSWLVGLPQRVSSTDNHTYYTPSLGVYTKCNKPMNSIEVICTTIAVRGLSTDSHVFPTAWKASTVFLALGLTIMSVTVCTSLISCCIQSVFKKSIFTISGSTQAVAGICYIIGVMLYPMAWDTARVQKMCGKDASPFYPDDCSLGIGLWLAALGTFLTFVSACMSVPAEKSTSSDKVQDQIYEGNTLICLI